ncbi:MAG: hypothetical protein ACI837_001109 [Crocinitomicaceae bacterium]|jgi:hypothetical protein
MRKLIVVFVLGVLSISSSLAGGPRLVDEIKEKVILDLSDVELNQYAEDYVLVSFKIVNGKIEIKDISGTQVELKKLIVKKLVQMNIESNYNVNALYSYKFKFEKV